MSTTLEIQSALQTHHANIELACSEKKNTGLALPSILESLKSLPEDTQETVGTLTRSTVIRLLVVESFCDSAVKEIESRLSLFSTVVRWLCRKVLDIPVETKSRDDKAFRSLMDEALWLAQNIHRESVTECLLLADFAFIAGMHAEAKQIYGIGLETAMRRAKDHPGEAIFE